MARYLDEPSGAKDETPQCERIPCERAATNKWQVVRKYPHAPLANSTTVMALCDECKAWYRDSPYTVSITEVLSADETRAMVEARRL